MQAKISLRKSSPLGEVVVLDLFSDGAQDDEDLRWLIDSGHAKAIPSGAARLVHKFTKEPEQNDGLPVVARTMEPQNERPETNDEPGQPLSPARECARGSALGSAPDRNWNEHWPEVD